MFSLEKQSKQKQQYKIAIFVKFIAIIAEIQLLWSFLILAISFLIIVNQFRAQYSTSLIPAVLFNYCNVLYNSCKPVQSTVQYSTECTYVLSKIYFHLSQNSLTKFISKKDV